MDTLVQAGLITKIKDSYGLAYYLNQPGMISTTDYRVLQSQKNIGLADCIHAVHNGYDKLVYGLDDFASLDTLLPGLSPQVFWGYVARVVTALDEVAHVGFLKMYCVETTLDKIYVNEKTGEVRLVYLPLVDTYAPQMNMQYESNIKGGILWAVQSYPNLQNPAFMPVCEMLANPGVSVAQLKNTLVGAAPANVAPPETVPLPTGRMGSGRLHSGEVNHGASGQLQAAPVESEQTAKKEKAAKEKRGFFWKRGAKSGELTAQQDDGSTEVLDEIFVPSVVLAGVENKAEFLIDKQDFVLGSRSGAADGKIEASTAVSRMHCKITHVSGKNYISDLGSANGTFVNGRKLEGSAALPINEGDRVKLANVTFVVKPV